MIDTLLTRIRAEFLEMPGLRLTLAQAARLFGVELPLCEAVLHAMVDAGFLCRMTNDTYARRVDGEPSRLRPARATFKWTRVSFERPEAG